VFGLCFLLRVDSGCSYTTKLFISYSFSSVEPRLCLPKLFLEVCFSITHAFTQVSSQSDIIFIFVESSIMKSSELLRLLLKDGWYAERQSGSHVIMKHTQKEGQLSVPLHARKEVKKGLLNAILKKAKIKTTKR
jgi:predicted RNA binding protein YcfA (HicA-like mRNA interferase family)